MNEVTLNPDSWGARQIILQAVNANLDSPVAYAFEDGFPVALTLIEADEVFDAVEAYQPIVTQPHAETHKEIALDAIRKAQQQSDAEIPPELLEQIQ